MRVIILGAVGEVGQSVARALTARGHFVTPISSRAPLTEFPDIFSVADAVSLLELGDADLLVNCAGRGDRRVSERTGVDATRAIVGALSRSGIPGVLLSTTRVLEGTLGSATEDAQPRPTSDYAKANSENERIWLQARSDGGRLSVLRLTNYFAAPIAADSPQSRLLPWSLVDEAVKNGTITMRSGSQLSKDFVSADDVASALELLAGHSHSPALCATAPGLPVTLSELADLTATAVATAGLEAPLVTFGPDGEAVSHLGAGWLSSQGWTCTLTPQVMVSVMLEWISPRIDELQGKTTHR
jgi:nucleoside-diphosphate-sugar epimerase